MSCAVCSHLDQTVSASRHVPYFNCQYQLHCRYVLNCAAKQTTNLIAYFPIINHKCLLDLYVLPAPLQLCACFVLLPNRHYSPNFF
jgi:hypothetical protein